MSGNRHDDGVFYLPQEEIFYCTPTTTAGAETAPSAVNLAFFDAEKVDHHIRHWRRKAAAAPDAVTRAVANGHVSGLQFARVIHGLPLLGEDE
jgi:hypothetical protein